jgi:hypothetical protein
MVISWSFKKRGCDAKAAASNEPALFLLGRNRRLPIFFGAFLAGGEAQQLHKSYM